MNFVSAGLRKSAAEEKQQQQQKGEGGSDDSDDDGPSAPPPPRGIAPKKLQMVSFVVRLFFTCCCVFCYSALSKTFFLLLFFLRVISGGTSPRGLQVAYSLVKALVTGRSTRRELDRNFCRKWATNQAKVWARMLKVGRPEEALLLRCSATLRRYDIFWPCTLLLLQVL